MKTIWNKLKQNRFTFARISALVFVMFIFVGKSAQASNFLWSIAKVTVLDAIGQVGVFFVSIMGVLLDISQSFFRLTLVYNLRFGDKLEIIKIGWDISRDVANIFFIVVLLVIAIATILRIGSYTAKQLLPGLIIMAILINFSLTIGLVVVDVSNTLGLQFYNAITDNDSKPVTEVIMQGTGLQHIMDFKNSTEDSLALRILGSIPYVGTAAKGLVEILQDSQAAEAQAMAFATLAFGNAIFMSILVFVFFISGIILLVRVVVISTLLMLAPLAFLFYILPDTKSHWNKWWSTLVQHCFFLPAFLFLLYFALVFILKISAFNSGVGGNFLDKNNSGLVFAYILAIVLLVQALVIGRTMGVMGASTAISWAKSGRKMATAFVGSQTIGRASGRLLSSEKVQKFIENRKPWIGRTLQGVVERGAAVGGRQKSADATAAFVSRMSPEAQAKKWEQMSFAEKQALLRKLNKDQRDKLLGNLTGDQRKLADRILGTSLAADQKADLDASQYQRMQGTEEQKREAYAGLSREAKERVLRTMNQDEKADFIKKLREDGAKPNKQYLADAADISENILEKDFAPNEYTAYKVSQFKNDTAANQLARFSNPNDNMLDAKTRSAILFGMKDDEREAFLQKLHNIDPAQRTDAEKIMKDYFPQEKLLEAEAARVNAIKDPKEQRTAFLALKDTKAQEAILRKKTDQQRALFLKDLVGQDKKDAEKTLKEILTPTEYAKYEAQAFLLKSQQDQATTFGGKDATGEDYISDFAREEILRQKKDPNAQALFVENLNQTSKDKAKQIVDSVFAPDEAAAFHAAEWNLLPPEKQAVEFANATEPIQEKIIRSLTGERRAGFLATLNASQRATADDIIKNNFSLDERAAIYAEEWKLKEDKGDNKDKTNFFVQAPEDIRALAQEKILAGFKDADERERFISGMETRKEQGPFAEAYRKVADETRQLLASTRFTATQRSEFKKARTKQSVTLADNAGLLSGYFMLEQDPKIRGEMLEAMNERQQIEMIEEAKKGPASMAIFSDAVLKMKPHLRESFTTKTLSHASNEAIASYFVQKDAEIQANALDVQKQDELRNDKKRAFKGLHGDAKAALWAEALAKDNATGDTREMEEFKRLMEGSNTTEIDSYRSALGRVLGDKIIESPSEAASMYVAMDDNSRQLYLKSSGGRTLVSKLYENAPAGSDIPEMIRADFAATNQINSKEFGKMIKRRENVTTERTYNVAKGISDAAETQIIQQQGVPNMAQGISEAAKAQIIQQNTVNMAQGISEAAKVQGASNVAAGVTEAAKAATTPLTVTVAPQGVPAPVPSRAMQQKTSVEATTTKGVGGGSIGGEGRKNMDQAAVKAAREASGGGGAQATLPKNIEKVLSQPPANAAKAFTTLPQKDKTLVLQNKPQAVIDMLNDASPETLPTIINDIQQSAPAKQFREANGTQGRLNALNNMSSSNKIIAFEAMASSNNPQELKTLRSVISSMPEKEKQEFITNVVAQGSKASIQTYLKEVTEEKTIAQKAGRADDVERLTKEETSVITTLQKPLETVQASIVVPSPIPKPPSPPTFTPPTSGPGDDKTGGGGGSSGGAVGSSGGPKPSAQPKAPQLGEPASPELQRGRQATVQQKMDTVIPPSSPVVQSPQIQTPPAGGQKPSAQPKAPQLGGQVDSIRPNGNGKTSVAGVPPSSANIIAGAGAMREATGALQKDTVTTDAAAAAIKQQLEKTEKEREIEHANMAPVVESKENKISESKEEKTEQWIDDIMAIEAELKSANLNESSINQLLKKIDEQINLLDGLQRAEKDPIKTQAFTNIIGRFKALKAKAEAKLKK